MAFWEVHGPLGGLSLLAASRGQEAWGGGLAKGMGSCCSGDDGRPVGVGTPAVSPWSREGRI